MSPNLANFLYCECRFEFIEPMLIFFSLGSNQIQDQTRPILRPPPMPPSFGTTQGSSQGGIDENDRNYTADEGMNCSLLKYVFF